MEGFCFGEDKAKPFEMGGVLWQRQSKTLRHGRLCLAGAQSKTLFKGSFFFARPLWGRAKLQKTATPELVSAVKAGIISINAAVASLPGEQQIAAVARGKIELRQAARPEGRVLCLNACKTFYDEGCCCAQTSSKSHSGGKDVADPSEQPFAVKKFQNLRPVSSAIPTGHGTGSLMMASF